MTDIVPLGIKLTIDGLEYSTDHLDGFRDAAHGAADAVEELEESTSTAKKSV